jgi:hypothetical protein
MLSPSDLYLLSDRSGYQVVVNKSIDGDIGNETRADISKLHTIHVHDPDSTLFQLAATGSTSESRNVNEMYRGDQRCWLTPDVCKKHRLNGVERLIRAIMNTCSKQLKHEHGLNGEYSVQATLYVS